MIVSRAFAALCLSGALLFAPAALAQKVSPDPEGVAKLLREDGAPVRILTPSEDGYPRVSTSASGITYEIWFFGCTNGKDCNDIQLYAGFPDTGLKHDDMADWNREHRWGRAYIDLEGDANIEMDVVFERGGPSAQFLRDTIGIWSITLVAFNKYIVRD